MSSSNDKPLKLIDGNQQADIWDDIFADYGDRIPKRFGSEDGQSVSTPSFRMPLAVNHQIIEILDRTDGYYKNKGEICLIAMRMGLRLLYKKWFAEDGKLIRDDVFEMCRNNQLYEDRRNYLNMAREQRSRAMKAWSDGLLSENELQATLKRIVSACPDEQTRKALDKIFAEDI